MQYSNRLRAIWPPLPKRVLTPRQKAAVTEKLARFKHPRRYEVVAELPRNTMGKVQKNLLRDEYRNACKA